MTAPLPRDGPTRRRFMQAAVGLLVAGPHALRAQPQRIPIADMHSHYGMIRRRVGEAGLASDMRDQRVALLAWKLVADGRWIRSTPTGIEQAAEPAPGDLAKYLSASLDRMTSYLAEHKLRTGLPPVD